MGGWWWWYKPNIGHNSNSTLGGVELTWIGDGVEMELGVELELGNNSDWFNRMMSYPTTNKQTTTNEQTIIMPLKCIFLHKISISRLLWGIASEWSAVYYLVTSAVPSLSASHQDKRWYSNIDNFQFIKVYHSPFRLSFITYLFLPFKR